VSRDTFEPVSGPRLPETPTTLPRESRHLLSPEEVREHLGLSRTYVYRLLASGALPSLRIGRVRRVRPTDLERFIESRLDRRKQAADA
jgi:excisionase family DNA binding protein